MSENWELMHRLADGEVDASEKAAAMELVATDKTCANEYAWAKYLKTTLASSCKPVEDQVTWEKCMGRLDNMDKVRTSEHLVGKYAWAACLVLVVGILAAGITNRTMGAKTVTSTQIASLLNPSSGGGTGMPEVESATSLSLDGYRVTSTVNGTVDGKAFVRYSLRDRLNLGGLALVVIQNMDQVEGIGEETRVRGIKSGLINGTNAVTWRVGNDSCLLLGERTTDELTKIAVDLLD